MGKAYPGFLRFQKVFPASVLRRPIAHLNDGFAAVKQLLQSRPHSSEEVKQECLPTTTNLDPNQPSARSAITAKSSSFEIRTNCGSEA